MSDLPLIHLVPNRHRAPLHGLKQRLHHHGFGENAVHELYGQHLGYRDGSLFPAYFWRLGSANNALGQLAMLFLQRVPQDRQTLNALLGQEVVDALLEIGIFTEEGQIRSNCDLHPRGDQYIFTDHRWAEGADKVYHLGGDSYLLPMFACYAQPRRLLDLCTGSGIQAISNGQAQELHLVDINPRALQFARLNLLLNGLEEKSHVHLGNLWEAASYDAASPQPPASLDGGPCAAPPKPPAIQDLSFDWISMNPPFIPDFENSELLLFQGGGGSGEEITRTVLQGAQQHLEIGGTLAIVTNAPERRGEHQIDKLRKWLGDKSPWGITHLVRHRVARDTYIAGILDRNRIFSENPALEAERLYAGQFIQHLKHYERHAIESMLEVVYLIEKLPSSATLWGIELELGAAVCNQNNNRFMKVWQESLRITHSAAWADNAHFSIQEDTGFSGTRLVTNNPLEGLVAHDFPFSQLATYLKSPRSGRQLLEWAQDRDALQQSLQQLAVWGALQTQQAALSGS